MRVAANGVQSAKHLMKKMSRPRQATKCMALEVAGRKIMMPIMITTVITLTKVCIYQLDFACITTKNKRRNLERGGFFMSKPDSI